MSRWGPRVSDNKEVILIQKYVKNVNVNNYGIKIKSLKQKLQKEFSQFGPLYILALPGLIFLILFSYVPMSGLIIVFKDYKFKDGMFGSAWVGFKNFEFFFYDMSKALRATNNTIILNFLFIITGTVIAVALAIMMNEVKNKLFKKITQSVMFFPYFISWIIIGIIVYILLSPQGGFINATLAHYGFKSIDFYSDPKYWRTILVLANIWKGAGYGSIIYFAVLNGFDPSYYEAAIVDGASRMQQICKITIPMLIPTIVIMTLLAVGRILYGDLSMIMGLTNLNPLLLPTTDIIDTYVYRSAIRSGEFSYTSAIALYQSVFGFILVVAANHITGLFSKESKLF